MRIHRDLAVLDLAEQIVVEVIQLVTAKRTRLLFRSQLLKSAESVNANIGEAFGRATVADRNRSLGIGRSEAEETIRHLHANYTAKRIEGRVYWRLHNRLTTVIKMISALVNR